jgi:hypothetical protein
LALIQRALPESVTASAATARANGALSELCAALRLLGTLCSRDAHTAVELLHVELPGSGGDGGAHGADLLSLACQAATTLAALPAPPTDAIGA